MSGDLKSIVDRLEAVTSRLEGLAAKGGSTSGGGGGADVAEFVDEYDDQVLGGKLKNYLDLSKKIGGDVAEHSKLVQAVFQTQRAFLVVAGTHKAPPPAVFASAIKPQSDKINDVQVFCDKRRGSKVFNHLMAIKEGIGCIGWVTVAPKPVKYVKEMHDQAQFYGNRVIKEYKETDKTHVEWVRAFLGAILELQDYVKQHHTAGLSWNPEGPVLSGAPPPPPPAGAGPPPPPPPPAVQPPTDTGKSDSEVAARANLFADISKGSDVTKGLKKVTRDMQTHKNPELRASSVVKATDIKPAAAKPAPKFGSAAATKKPVCELQGKKWVVEYQDGNDTLEITNTNAKQAVYVFRCNKSTIQVKGKVNSIIIDNCKRVALVLDDVISAVEIINSQSIQVQVLGKCPTVSIDKTDGCQVYLSKASIGAEIVSAKSSEMNVCIPKPNGEYSEHSLPEQFKSRWNGKAMVTDCTDINA